MTKSEFDAIRLFAERLSIMRIQLSDGPLLDRCQTALNNLIAELAPHFDARLNVAQAEMPKRPEVPFEATPAPHYPEPAHIEDVPKDDPESGSINDEEPPVIQRPERIMPVEEPKKKTHRKRVHHR